MMSVEFRSIFQPLIRLVTMPIALVGAIMLLAAIWSELDISAGIRNSALAGIAVNNAILFPENANRQPIMNLSSFCDFNIGSQ